MLKKIFLISFTSLLCLCSSTTSKKQYFGLDSLLKDQMFDEALIFVEKDEEEFYKKEKLLSSLDQAILHHYLADYRKSNSYLTKAKKALKNLEKKADDLIATANTKGEAYIEYSARDPEKVFVSMFSGLNYLLLQKYAEAKQEFTEAADLIQKLNTAYLALHGKFIPAANTTDKDTLLAKFKYLDDGFIWYLLGKSLEMNGEFEKSLEAYARSFDIYLNLYRSNYNITPPEGLTRDYIKLANHFAREEDIKKIKDNITEEEHNKILENIKIAKESGLGEIIFIHYNGLINIFKKIPVKVGIKYSKFRSAIKSAIPELNKKKDLKKTLYKIMNRIFSQNPELFFDIKGEINEFKQSQAENEGEEEADIGANNEESEENSKIIFLPFLNYRYPLILNTVVFKGDTFLGKTMPAEDLSGIIKADFDDKYDYESIKAVMKATLKLALNKTVESSKSEKWRGKAENFSSQISDLPELRIWRTLPAKINLLNLYLKPGYHNFDIFYNNRENAETKRVNCEAQKTVFIVLTSPSYTFSKEVVANPEKKKGEGTNKEREQKELPVKEFNVILNNILFKKGENFERLILQLNMDTENIDKQITLLTKDNKVMLIMKKTSLKEGLTPEKMFEAASKKYIQKFKFEKEGENLKLMILTTTGRGKIEVEKRGAGPNLYLNFKEGLGDI